MAIAITNLRGECILIAKNTDDMNLAMPHNGLYDSAAGQKHDISESEFTQVQQAEKHLKFDGTSLVYEDVNMSFNNEQALITYINIHKTDLEKKVIYLNEGTLKTDAENYIGILDTFDTSSVSFPMTTSLEKHMSDLGHTVVSSLQL